MRFFFCWQGEGVVKFKAGVVHGYFLNKVKAIQRGKEIVKENNNLKLFN